MRPRTRAPVLSAPGTLTTARPSTSRAPKAPPSLGRSGSTPGQSPSRDLPAKRFLLSAHKPDRGLYPAPLCQRFHVADGGHAAGVFHHLDTGRKPGATISATPPTIETSGWLRRNDSAKATAKLRRCRPVYNESIRAEACARLVYNELGRFPHHTAESLVQVSTGLVSEGSLATMRIAVICEDDPVWKLGIWERTLPFLTEKQLRPVGLWVCPASLSRHKGTDIYRWYLHTFGIYDFLKLGLFAVTAHATRLLGLLTGTRVTSFQALAHKHHIQFDRCATSNDERFVAWLRDEQIDILVIMVSHILKDEVLAAPRIGTISRHAAVLPANRGLFPYFWAELKGMPQGISFHEVVRGVDRGRLLIQERITDIACQRSMVAFYWRAFQRYPEMLLAAIAALVERRFLPNPPDVEAGYFGLPTRRDVRSFREQKGKIILWRDIVYASKL